MVDFQRPTVKPMPSNPASEPQAGCEERNCGCEDIQAALDNYNKAIESLSKISVSSEIGWEDLLNKLKLKLESIQYDSTDTNPCNQCGSCGDLVSTLKRVLGDKLGNAVSVCCGPNGGPLCKGGLDRPAFKDLNYEVTPCGEAADNNMGIIKLLPCEIDFPQEEKELELYSYTCASAPTPDCKDKITIALIPDDTPFKIKLPVAKPVLDELSKIIEAIKDFYRKSIQAQELGGKKQGFKDEACLVTLLNFMCSDQIKGIDRDLNDNGVPVDIRCHNAMLNAGIGCDRVLKESGGRFLKKSPNNFCRQMIQRIGWNHTLTYGHVGNAVEGCPENYNDNMGEKNPAPLENDIPFPCADANRIRAKETVFVPTPPNPTDANWTEAVSVYAKKKLDQLSENHPEKCPKKVDSKGNPNLRFEPLLGTKITGECNGGACPCGADVVDGDNTPDPQQQKMLDDLKKQVYNLQLQKAVIDGQISANNLRITNLQAGGVTGDEVFQINTLRATIATLEEQSKNLNNQIQPLLDQISGLQNTGKPLFGRCYSFWYSYCPANSTPPQAVDPGRRGGPQNQIPTRDKENDHSNFYDLLRKIREAGRALSALCPDGEVSAIEQIINSCFKGSQTGKDPMGNMFGNDSGPTLNPGDPNNGISGSPCTDNDGTWTSHSGGPCVNKEGNENYEFDIQRRNCIVVLHNVLKKLTDQITPSKWPSLWNPEGNPLLLLVNFNKNIEQLESRILDLVESPMLDGVACKGWQTEASVEFINQTTEKINRLIETARKFEEIFSNFGPEPSE